MLNKKQIIGYNIFVKGLLEDQDEISAKDLNYWTSVWQVIHIDLINSNYDLDKITLAYATENIALNKRLLTLKDIRFDERVGNG